LAVSAVLVLVALVLGLVAGPARAGNEPTAQQLRQQRAEAARLHALAGQRALRTQSARQRLGLLAQQAGHALDRYVVARNQARLARAAADLAQGRLEHAQRVVAYEQRELGRYVSAAYVNGGTMSDFSTVTALLQADSITEVTRAAGTIAFAGNQQGHTVERVRTAKVVADEARQQATAARAVAARAEAHAADEKKAADALVKQQQALVAELAARAARTKQAAAQAKATAHRMAVARRIAAERRAAAARARALALQRGALVQVAGTCSGGGGTTSYSNGQMPASALCPLWGAPGQVLRADAAAAFDRMSKAYAAHFGRPITVTDSYRSYAAQVACREQKGDLCATPGTSNHGWGTAVDLGDGVNSYGTVTYDWLKANSTRFGWFHPSWAEPGGSKPEPWHWEFAG
jgi:LAS superfamily LD-carboxypeptidase LdcB